MYIITDQLKNLGVSLNRMDHLIERNHHNRHFNTLEYYCIYIFLESIKVEVENIPYSIRAGHIAFLGPQKQIVFGKGSASHILSISFSAGFYERSSRDSLFLHSQLFFNYHTDFFIAPFSNTEHMRVIFMERMEAFRQKDENLYVSAAHNAIERLILDAFLYIPNEEIKKDVKFDYLHYVNRFKVLLQRDYKKEKKVAHYASELNITSRRLTEMTEYVLGKTAKNIIIEKVITEFKKTLAFTNSTISEISFDLGFSDEGNFSNFVKKHTGKNPSEMK
jgi:AraC family transcriptional regulator, transcriptional activator of pobA